MTEKYKYDISVCATAVRTELWIELYELYMRNSASIEIVFVGDKYPSYKLPDNFKFIYSEVKPAQCVEIATRNCSGEHILIQADDCFPEEYYCDNMLSLYKKNVNEFPTQKIVTGGSLYYENNVKSRIIGVWPKGSIPFNPMPMDFFIANKWYKDIGGIDKNFVGMYEHFDLVLRIIEQGGKYVYNNFRFIEKQEESTFLSKTAKVRPIDQKYFRSLWWCYWYKERWKKKYKNRYKDMMEYYKNELELLENKITYHAKNTRGFIPMLRNKKFEPFDDNDILIKSQGATIPPWDNKGE